MLYFRDVEQESRLTQRAPDPQQRAPEPWWWGIGAFSSTLRGLKLVPLKGRCLVPPTSTPEGA